MSERPHRPNAPAHEPGTDDDRDLDARGIVGFGIGLAAIIAVSMALVWFLSAHFKSSEIARDPEPSPLAAANAHRQPPEPRLQAEPVLDMTALRAKEDAVLKGYGWSDRTSGTAQIPIDRAIDILARTGLPVPPRPATPARVAPEVSAGSVAPDAPGGAPHGGRGR